MLSNAPIYIPPKKPFRYINFLPTSFLWGNKAARVSLELLQLPVRRGVLAVPDLRLYYLAAQLVQVHWRMFPQLNNAAIAVEAVVATSYETLLNFSFRGEVSTADGRNMLKTAKRTLGICLKHIDDGPLHLSPNAPLWYNPCLKEFFHLEDGYRWAKFGLTFLHQLFDNGNLKSFTQIKRELNIPDSWAFQFARLKHATQAQFGLGPVSL